MCQKSVTYHLNGHLDSILFLSGQPSNKDTIRSVLSVQEELKSVLDIFNKREKHLEIIKTPEVYITASSTPREVQKWLKEKQFSKRFGNLIH
jgi:hypothetical protein